MGILPSQVGAASSNAGVTLGGSSPWMCVKPAPAATYAANYYSDTINPDAGLRGGLPDWTFGVLHLVREHTLPVAGISGYLWDTGIGGAPPGTGHQGFWDGAGTSGDPVTGLTGKFHVNVGTDPGGSKDFTPMGAGSGPPPSSADASYSPAQQNISGGVQLTALAVDPGYTYPSTDRFWINGRPMTGAGAPGFGGGWENSGPGGGPFKLGVDIAGSFPTSDYIIGLFLHSAVLTDEQMFLLRKNVEATRSMTDVDNIGGGVVALDHFWDVRGAGMTPGTGTAAATWTSVGAVGGIILDLTGALDVVEVEAGFNIR